MEARPLSIPVILGTGRKGRMSAHAARFVHGELRKREDVLTELIDVASLALRLDDNGEGTAGPARAGPGDDLLGRERRERGEGLRPERGSARPGARAPDGQVPGRADVDGPLTQTRTR